MNNIKVKRFMAYLVDIFIISALIVLMSEIKFLNPHEAKYEAAVKELDEYLDETANTTVDEEYLEKYASYVKDVSYYGLSYSLIQIGVIVLYFTLFPIFNKNMTIGKRIMKVKVVNLEDEKAKVPILKHFGKALLCPIWTSILLYNTLFNIIVVIAVLLSNEGIFLNIYSYGALAACAFCYIDVISACANKDGISFTDRITGTKVINLC